MLAITRSKLEAFSGSSSSSSRGRRVAPSLRQIVLLSNVFGKSQWEEEENRRREMEELDKKRSLQETQWLDGLLEEMAEQEEEDEEEEEEFFRSGFRYQSWRTRKVDDSGFLESSQDTSAHEGGAVAGPSSHRGLAFIEEEDLSSPLASSSGSISPPSPPSPCRSPPIDVPAPKAIPFSTSPHTYQYEDSHDDYSYSPPLHPPALTPDHSPPGPGAAGDLFTGGSYDSIDREMEVFLERRHTWIPESEYRVAHSFVDHTSGTATSTSNDKVDPTLNLQASFTQHSFPSTSPSSLPIPPIASTSLALTIIPKNPPSTPWTPPTPRHLSLPSLNLHHPPSPVPFLFHHNIVKYYDTYDFRYSPLDAPWPDEASAERGREHSLALTLLSNTNTPPYSTGSGSNSGNGIGLKTQEREVKGRAGPWKRSSSHEERKKFWEGDEVEVD